MAAGMHDERGVAGYPRDEAVGRIGAGTSALSAIRPDVTPAERLLDHGTRLRFRAPELALVFGERAAALAEAAGSEHLWVNAEGLSVFARMRMGQRPDVVHRAVTVLRTAEADGHAELAAQMRVELAVCARSAGVPLTGLAALRPVLSQRDLPAVCRALALMQLVGCMAPVGRQSFMDRALAEADRLIRSDAQLPDVDRILLRAMVASRTAAHQRRHGDLAASLDTGQRALDLLDGLDSDAHDGMQLRARVVLDMACALLDRGENRRAMDIAQRVLSRPARAAAVGPLAWLRLALATRLHLSAGEAEAAGRLVRDALHSVQRYDLTWIEARLWLELSHVEEAAGRERSALHAAREARRCEHVYGRARRQAINALTGEFGRGEESVVDLAQLLGMGEPPSARDSGARGQEKPSAHATGADRASAPSGLSAPKARQAAATGQTAATEPKVASLPSAESKAASELPRKYGSAEPAAETSGSGSAKDPGASAQGAKAEPKVTLPLLNLPTISLPKDLDPTLHRSEQHGRPPLRLAGSGAGGEGSSAAEPAQAGGGGTGTAGGSAGEATPLRPWLAALGPSQQPVNASSAHRAHGEQGTGPRRGNVSETPAGKAAETAAGGTQEHREPEHTPRHRRSEGGTAARSVLERLGVKVGTGGRRRAPESSTPGASTADSSATETASGVGSGADPTSSLAGAAAEQPRLGSSREAAPPGAQEVTSMLPRIPASEPPAEAASGTGGRHAASGEDTPGREHTSDGTGRETASGGTGEEKASSGAGREEVSGRKEASDAASARSIIDELLAAARARDDQSGSSWQAKHAQQKSSSDTSRDTTTGHGERQLRAADTNTTSDGSAQTSPTSPTSGADKPVDSGGRSRTTTGRTEPPRLDSLLSIFRDWPDDDELAGSLSSRARRLREESAGSGESRRTNGRRFTGDDRPWGHHGDL